MNHSETNGRSIPELSNQVFSDRLFKDIETRPVPINCQWEITCRCNLKCVMCYTDCFNTPEHIRQELSFKEITRIMDEIAAAGCMELCLTGGEPLSRPDFLDIYAYAKSKGFFITVFTNGTLFTKEILDYWTENPPFMIEISFHGSTTSSFDSITQMKGSFEKCLEGIGWIQERGLPLMIKTVGMSVNFDEVQKIKAYVKGLRNTQFKWGSEIRPRLDGNRDVARYQLDEDKIYDLEQNDPDFKQERERQDEKTESALAADRELCGGGKTKFHIDAYGRLQLCSSNRQKSYDLKNGSFEEGFYQMLPKFPCKWRKNASSQKAVCLNECEG